MVYWWLVHYHSMIDTAPARHPISQKHHVNHLSQSTRFKSQKVKKLKSEKVKDESSFGLLTDDIWTSQLFTSFRFLSSYVLLTKNSVSIKHSLFSNCNQRAEFGECFIREWLNGEISGSWQERKKLRLHLFCGNFGMTSLTELAVIFPWSVLWIGR